MLLYLSERFFFYQAVDGIRDIGVTGVQTCALPISLRRTVEARDRHCVFTGCSAPTSYCDVHHVQEWLRDDGPTSLENSALDRKSVVQGKSVDLGGRRIIKKKKLVPVRWL